MHELALCSAIAEIVGRRAGGRPVGVVHLRIGELRQVVPSTLEFCWSIVSAQGPLAGSVLAVERVPALIRCRVCRAEHGLGDGFAVACADCGSFDVDVVAGEECLVTALDLQEV